VKEETFHFFPFTGATYIKDIHSRTMAAMPCGKSAIPYRDNRVSPC